MGVVRGAAAIVIDVALEAAQAFAPLRAVLGAISVMYRNYEVRLRSLFGLSSDKVIYRKPLPSRGK